MKSNLSILLLLTVGIFTSCKLLQYQDVEYPSTNNSERKFEDGKCYSECLIPDKYRYAFQSENFAIYTGNELEETVEIEVKQIELRPNTKKWVKMKADKNCISPNPDDCLVWCLIEAPAIIKEIKILVDTTESINYTLQSVNYEEVFEKGGFKEWREVLCDQDITELTIGQIQNSLREEGYYDGENSLELDEYTESSLTKFQRDNRLPIGYLDFETLVFLGIPRN